MIGCITCQSYDLLGSPQPFKVAKVPRVSAVSLKLWLRETVDAQHNYTDIPA